MNFGYAFPFEGNGNSSLPKPASFLERRTLDMLSRWKGMETHWTAHALRQGHRPLDMLSRLKGMETIIPIDTYRLANFLLLWICFPVGREWKRIGRIGFQCLYQLWICFPVWREWKLQYDFRSCSCSFSSLDMLSRWKGRETWRLS